MAKNWTIHNTKIATWFERDRVSVILSDLFENDIMEWWDDGVQEAITDGFLDPKDYHASAVEYANSLNLGDDPFKDFYAPERARALCLALDLGPGLLYESKGDLFGEGFSYRVGGQGPAYAVLTEDEADTAYDTWLDEYIAETVLPRIPEDLQFYFDEEQYKKDSQSDRGGALSSYDGNETDATDPETGDSFVIFRTN